MGRRRYADEGEESRITRVFLEWYGVYGPNHGLDEAFDTDPIYLAIRAEKEAAMVEAEPIEVGPDPDEEIHRIADAFMRILA